MSTKRFEAATLEQAAAVARAELGPGARVVSAARVRTGGLGGWFARESVEVTVEDGSPDAGDAGGAGPGHRRRDAEQRRGRTPGRGSGRHAAAEAPVRGVHARTRDVAAPGAPGASARPDSPVAPGVPVGPGVHGPRDGSRLPRRETTGGGLIEALGLGGRNGVLNRWSAPVAEGPHDTGDRFADVLADVGAQPPEDEGPVRDLLDVMSRQAPSSVIDLADLVDDGEVTSFSAVAPLPRRPVRDWDSAAPGRLTNGDAPVLRQAPTRLDPAPPPEASRPVSASRLAAAAAGAYDDLIDTPLWRSVARTTTPPLPVPGPGGVPAGSADGTAGAAGAAAPAAPAAPTVGTAPGVGGAGVHDAGSRPDGHAGHGSSRFGTVLERLAMAQALASEVAGPPADTVPAATLLAGRDAAAASPVALPSFDPPSTTRPMPVPTVPTVPTVPQVAGAPGLAVLPPVAPVTLVPPPQTVGAGLPAAAIPRLLQSCGSASGVLVRLGLPEVGPAATDLAPRRRRDWHDLLVEALAGLPSPAPLPTAPGSLLAVVGRPSDGAIIAASFARAIGVDPSEIVVATGRTTRRVPPSMQLRCADHAGDLRRSLRWRTGPTVVLVEAEFRPSGDEWAHDILASLTPTQCWGVLDASRKTEDIRSWSEVLGGFDALALCRTVETSTPASPLSTGIPVGLLDGEPATAASWADVLCDHLPAALLV